MHDKQINVETHIAEGFIDGEVVVGTRKSIPVLDPALITQEVGVGIESNHEDVERAVEAADQAFRTWSKYAPSERARAMLSGADAIAAEADDLSALLVREVGKPAHDCVGDVKGGVHLLRSFAELAGELSGFRDLTGQPGTAGAEEALLQRVPVGPSVVITPWNTPVYLCLNAVSPALIAGCTVVVKPSEEAPLALTRALHLLARSLPSGVLNVVPGYGATVGDQLVRHPAVRAISLTGGVATGRAVLKGASDTVKKTSLELGGNDPAIILDDADFSVQTLRELAAGAFSVSGQVCFNIKRIYVHENRFEEFVELFSAVVDQLIVGPGDVDGVHLGPLTTDAGYQNALRLLEQSRRAGHHVHVGGQWAEGVDPEAGQFIRPTIVTGLASDDELVLEEQFAPIVPVMPFAHDESAITEANRTEYGLASSVWSSDPDRAISIARRVQAGNTFINAHRVGASVPLVPFGGVKQSGLGRNHLHYAIAEFSEEHAVVRYSMPWNQIPGITPWETLKEGHQV